MDRRHPHDRVPLRPELDPDRIKKRVEKITRLLTTRPTGLPYRDDDQSGPDIDVENMGTAAGDMQQVAAHATSENDSIRLVAGNEDPPDAVDPTNATAEQAELDAAHNNADELQQDGDNDLEQDSDNEPEPDSDNELEQDSDDEPEQDIPEENIAKNNIVWIYIVFFLLVWVVTWFGWRW